MRFTPFPKGEMPDGVKVWEDGPPYGRLELDLDRVPNMSGDGDIVTDANTGQQFRITSAPCGLGCRCAAEAEWVPSS